MPTEAANDAIDAIDDERILLLLLLLLVEWSLLTTEFDRMS